eukprot:1892562-Amphidinium_carterae.2
MPRCDNVTIVHETLVLAALTLHAASISRITSSNLLHGLAYGRLYPIVLVSHFKGYHYQEALHRWF